MAVSQLHVLDASAVEAALEEAARCRQLGEPSLVESICLDVLEVAPQNESALCLLVHAICDQLLNDLGAVSRARQVLPRIQDGYWRELLSGVVLERHARALLRRRPKGSRSVSREEFLRAMEHYEAAEALAPTGTLEASLRRNACARALIVHGYLHAPSADDVEHPIE